ncbi:MAG: hypothetical protein R3C17_21025 [Planctomycetaceae bacterium]
MAGFIPPSAGAVDLAKNGRSSFVIVTDTEPSLEENTAAQWLSETLEQVTGAKFPVHAASPNDANAAKTNEIRIAFDSTLRPEEWRIETVDESLKLTGGQPRGVIYAVCEFLETHVGIERLDPFTEFVPKQPTLTIPAINRQGTPAFEYRYVFTGWPYQNSAQQGANGSRWRIWNKEHTYAGPATGDCHSPRCNSGRRTRKGAQKILNRQLKLKRRVVALARSSDDN